MNQDLHDITRCIGCNRCIEVDCPCGAWQEAVDGLCGRCLQKDFLTPHRVMNAILATSCPSNVLEDNWNVFQFELCDFTWEIEAKCVYTPQDPQEHLWYEYDIRSARIIPTYEER